MAHIPLEQGLRHNLGTIPEYCFNSLGAYSIRTRIKTSRHLPQGPQGLSVLAHIPLEQGLRLAFSSLHVTLLRSVLAHIPLEQGLRQ